MTKTISKPQVPLDIELIPLEKRNVGTLKTLYSERLGNIDEHVDSKLTEYFCYLSNAREDWWIWAFRGIVQASTKTQVQQRSIGYLIGIYKTWLNYGFGSFFSAETQKIVQMFVKKFNIRPSQESLRGIQAMISEFGLVSATIALTQVEAPDISTIIVNKAIEKCKSEVK